MTLLTKEQSDKIQKDLDNQPPVGSYKEDKSTWIVFMIYFIVVCAFLIWLG